jgi:uncharacterized protein (TIGR00369 family)
MDPSQHYSQSPFLSFVETSLEEWRDGYACIGLTLCPKHLNRSSVVHGGVLATLIDHSGAYAGLFCTTPGNRRYATTLSLTTNYVQQRRSGKLLAIGRVQPGGGRQIYYSSCEVRTEAGDLLATGTGVYRYRGGSESVAGVSRPPFSDGSDPDQRDA